MTRFTVSVTIELEVTDLEQLQQAALANLRAQDLELGDARAKMAMILDDERDALAWGIGWHQLVDRVPGVHTWAWTNGWGSDLLLHGLDLLHHQWRRVDQHDPRGIRTDDGGSAPHVRL